MDTKLDFADVLVVPKSNEFTSITSRSSVDLNVTYKFGGIEWTGIPIIASNMSTIGTIEMYNVLSKYSIITCFHKYHTINDFKGLKLDKNYYMLSSGIHEKDYLNLVNLIENLNPLFVCIDVANGYTTNAKLFAKNLKKRYPDIIVCFGNVVTEVKELHDNYDIDLVKVGIGSGSACSTRLKTGIGYPQFSAVIENRHQNVISDGGCVVPGDIVKALGGGAKFVMIGGMLSGHTECLGDVIEEHGNKYKIFYGMSSHLAMTSHGDGKKHYKTSEGHEIKVPYKGKVEHTINDILGGLRSACTYIGVSKLKDLINNCDFIKVNNQNNISLL